MKGETKREFGTRNAKRGTQAFTLIEMLVVVAIIAILAGLLLMALPGVKGSANRKRVKIELEALELAINSYKAKKHVFPPDNQINPMDTSRPPLFYELTGTLQINTDVNNPAYRSLFAPGDPPVARAQVQSAFGMEGFVNCAPENSAEKDEVQSFLKNVKQSQIQDIDGIKYLIAPYSGPNNQPARWNYNSSNPVHNPGEYDLWAEIMMGGKKEIIGNWKQH